MTAHLTDPLDEREARLRGLAEHNEYDHSADMLRADIAWLLERAGAGERLRVTEDAIYEAGAGGLARLREAKMRWVRTKISRDEQANLQRTDRWATEFVPFLFALSERALTARPRLLSAYLAAVENALDLADALDGRVAGTGRSVTARPTRAWLAEQVPLLREYAEADDGRPNTAMRLMTRIEEAR